MRTTRAARRRSSCWLALLPASASAWPAALTERIARDARRLVPRSLGMLMSEREKEIFEAAQRLPPELTQAVAADLVRGELQPSTIALLGSADGRGGRGCCARRR